MTFAELRSVTECHQQAVEVDNSWEPDDRAYRALCIAKRTTWMILLAGSFLFYYLLSKLHEAITLV